jgi:hypothetical protein
MRVFYPFLSEEFNDLVLEAYSHYVYLLGYDDIGGNTTYSGVYDITEANLDEQSRQYVVLRNDYAADGGKPMPQYLDSITAKLNLRRH